MLKNIILMSILLSSACAAQKSKTTQGIIGEVRWVEGNLMPAIGDTTYANRALGIPIQRDIYVYKVKKAAETEAVNGVFFPVFESGLVKKVKTKKDGTFKVALPPGKYSLFVMEKEGLFANRFDGEGSINPVVVPENQFVEVSILVNYKAAY